MFDCTSFVVHFFAKSRCNRHVERSETSVTLLRMTKGLGFGRSLRGTLAGLRRGRLRPASLKGGNREKDTNTDSSSLCSSE
jgi:hypothetical protein